MENDLGKSKPKRARQGDGGPGWKVEEGRVGREKERPMVMWVWKHHIQGKVSTEGLLLVIITQNPTTDKAGQ